MGRSKKIRLFWKKETGKHRRSLAGAEGADYNFEYLGQYVLCAMLPRLAELEARFSGTSK